MKKKLSALLCLALVAVMMIGCGASKEEAAETNEAVVEETEEAADGVDVDATDYPSRPVTSVVAWKVGGGQDLMTRAVANCFKTYANRQTMVVSNIEGASSVQGVTEYLAYDADGYTILSWGSAQTIKTHMQETEYFVTDFQPIANVVTGNPYILVKADSQFETVEDLVEYAKTNPGALTVGNSGAGGGNHLAALQFCLETGIEVNHIAYDGGAASAQAVLSGEIDCSFNVPSEGLTSVEAGDLRMLCILAEERSEFFPEVPTAKEMGYEVVNEQNRGFVVHKSVPAEMVEKLAEIIKQITEDEEFLAQAKELNMEVKYMGTEEYGTYLTNEDELYKEIIQTNGLGDRY